MKTVISVFICTQEFTEPFPGRIQVHNTVLLADCIFCLKKIVLSRKNVRSQHNVMKTTHQNIIKFQCITQKVYINKCISFLHKKALKQIPLIEITRLSSVVHGLGQILKPTRTLDNQFASLH